MYKRNPSKNPLERDIIKQSVKPLVSQNNSFEYIKQNNPFLGTQDFFERMIQTGTSKENILIIFNMNIDGMNIVCEHWYGKGMTYDVVFPIIQQKGFALARQMFNDLALTGNSAALNIVSRDLSIGDVSKSTLNTNESAGIVINLNNSVDRD